MKKFKEFLEESKGHSVVANKLNAMDNIKNVQIPSPAERRAQIEKRRAEAEAAKKNVKEEIEALGEIKSVEHDHIQQTLADKDINSSIENGKVKVHKDNISKARAHVKKLGYNHSVVGGLNEDNLDESAREHDHIQQSLADKDINSSIENGKVKVHNSNVIKTRVHLKRLGYNHSVVGGLNEDKDPCWKGYKQLGTKDKNGKQVPNCVKESIELSEATKDVKYNGWKVRYEIDSKNKEFRAMAQHEKSQKTPNINVTGTSSADALEKIKNEIDNAKGSKEINTADRVSILFNTKLSKEVIGHSDVVYSKIVVSGGKPHLIISEKPSPGFSSTADRSNLAAKSELKTGAHAFGMSGTFAKSLGLSYARYKLGKETTVDGKTAYPMVYDSEVHKGDKVELAVPGVTVAVLGKSK